MLTPEESEKRTIFSLRDRCKLCGGGFPRNHVIEVTYEEHETSVIFGPRVEVQEREPLEQIIVDPFYGLLKREIHLAITGYLNPPRRELPEEFAARFLKTAEQVFE